MLRNTSDLGTLVIISMYPYWDSGFIKEEQNFDACIT